MAHTRTAEEQTAFDAFQNAPSLFDAPADTPAGEPDAATVPATDGAPAVVADTPVVVPEVVTPSWRDDIIGANEGMPPVWVGRKRGEYTDAVHQQANADREAASAAERKALAAEAELEALRSGRVTLPAKGEPVPVAPSAMPYDLASEDDAYKQLPDVIRKQHAEIEELKADLVKRARAEAFAVCDRAYAAAREMVNPQIPAEEWAQWQTSVAPLMIANSLNPSDTAMWAWAGRHMRLDRVLAPSSAAPAPTQIVPRTVGAPLVGNSAPSAPLVAADTDTRRTTGNAEIDAVATEVVQLANRRAAREGEGRKAVDPNAVMEQYLKSRSGKR